MSRGVWVRFILVARPPGRVRGARRQRQAQPGPRPPRRRAVHLRGRGHRADPGQRRERRQDPRGAPRPRRRPRCRRVHAGPPGREPDPRRAARRHQRRGGPGGRGAHRQHRQADHPRGASAPPSPTPSPPRRTTRSCRPTRATPSRSAPRSSRARRSAARAPSSATRASSGSWRSTSTARAAAPGPTSPARPPATRPATPSAASRSSSTARSSPRPRSTTDVGCDVGIRGGSTDITGNFTSDRGQGPRRADRGRRAAARADGDLRPPRRPLAGCRGHRRLHRGRHHRHHAHRPLHHLRLPPRRLRRDDRAGVVRPARLRHARRARLDADPARPRGIRARHRHGDRRQRPRLRESEGGVRRLPLRGAAGARSPVGFNKAWSAIIDSNVTTLLAAGLLFFLGSGPIKGFGVTLSIGVIASMISALIIARVLCDLAVSNKPVARPPRRSAASATIGKVRTWLDRKDPQTHEAPQDVAGHLGRGARRRHRRHRHPGPQPRRRVHRRSPARLLASARTSPSTRRARPSPTPASPRPSCRPPTPPTSPSAPARSPTTRSSGSRTSSPRSAATVEQDRRPD